jgi:hypothetical protein
LPIEVDKASKMEALATRGSALATQWSGLKKQQIGKASGSAAPTSAGTLRAPRVVRMALAVDQKAYVTTKSEEIFAAAKVGTFSPAPR